MKTALPMKITISRRQNGKSQLGVTIRTDDGRIFNSGMRPLDPSDIKGSLEVAVAKAQGRNEASDETADDRADGAE